MASLNSVQQDLMKVNVSKWLELKNQMKQLRLKSKELKDAQSVIEKEIILTMKSNEIPQIQLQSGQLTLKTKESKKSLPPKWFKGELGKCVAESNENDIRESLNSVISKIDNRPSTVKESLVFKA
tara:strand:+ start:6340 stop:6714 length:375 start_codon:yes stop_codon:yes gene_type:complete